MESGNDPVGPQDDLVAKYECHCQHTVALVFAVYPDGDPETRRIISKRNGGSCSHCTTQTWRLGLTIVMTGQTSEKRISKLARTLSSSESVKHAIRTCWFLLMGCLNGFQKRLVRYVTNFTEFLVIDAEPGVLGLNNLAVSQPSCVRRSMTFRHRKGATAERFILNGLKGPIISNPVCYPDVLNSEFHQSRIKRRLFIRFYTLLLRSERSSDSGLPDPKSTVLERAEEPMGADVCLPGVFAVSTPESVLPSSTALGLEQELSEPSKTANQGDRDVLHRSLSTTPSSQNSIPSNLSSPASPSVSLPAAPLTSQACSSTPFSSTSIDVISTVLPTCTLVSSPISYPALSHSQCSPEYYTPLEPTEFADPDFLPAESAQRNLVSGNWDPTPIVHPPVNGDAGSISESLSVTKNNPVPICDTSILQAEDASIDTSSNANSTNSSVTRIFRSLLDFLSSQAGQFVRRFSTGRTPQLMAKPTGKAINYSPSLQSTSGSERAASIPDSATKPSRFFVWTLLTSEESAEIITSVTPDHLDPSNRRIRSLPTHYPAQTVMNDIAAIDEIKLPICSTRKLCELTDRFVYRRQCT
ncbi:hypothetical protein CLF_104122 [Clonorchis sinensis]|uniref:Uncharacterized protein n=1 Tax=Clonorchis sinensis TaxID=79923 RepID=G7YB11_CLOSI|nr:hypothetical protein CLF_104122 [Clonorchis sinensis]